MVGRFTAVWSTWAVPDDTCVNSARGSGRYMLWEGSVRTTAFSRRLRRVLVAGVLAVSVGAVTATASPASASVGGAILTTPKTSYVRGEVATFTVSVAKKVNTPKA